MSGKIIALVAFAITPLVLTACATHYTPTTPEAEYLAPEERSRLEHLAKNGDAKAAFDLGYYYEASAFDERAALKWFRLAKRLGDNRADGWITAINTPHPR